MTFTGKILNLWKSLLLSWRSLAAILENNTSDLSAEPIVSCHAKEFLLTPTKVTKFILLIWDDGRKKNDYRQNLRTCIINIDERDKPINAFEVDNHGWRRDEVVDIAIDSVDPVETDRQRRFPRVHA